MPATETAARPLRPRDARLEPWRAFLQAHARVTRRLDEELRAEHDLSLAEYDTLITIAWSPGRRVRMRTLADSILLSKSGVTRLIDRLVADGLVERDTCLTDARGAEAVLTSAGLDRLRSASRTHLRGIADHFLDVVDPEDLPVVERAMARVADRAFPGGDGQPWRPPTSADATSQTTSSDPTRRRGRLITGTSGFAYPGWIPRFYPAGTKAADLLATYAARLDGVELNNTFYQQPTAAKVAAWLAATPPTFRFSVKAQRGGSWRAMREDPEPGMPWLTDPYRAFGPRLGTVLFRIPDTTRRDDDRLAALLRAWPADLPLTLEFGDASWAVDEVTRAAAAAGVAICTTESTRRRGAADAAPDGAVPVPAVAPP